MLCQTDPRLRMQVPAAAPALHTAAADAAALQLAGGELADTLFGAAAPE